MELVGYDNFNCSATRLVVNETMFFFIAFINLLMLHNKQQQQSDDHSFFLGSYEDQVQLYEMRKW